MATLKNKNIIKDFVFILDLDFLTPPSFQKTEDAKPLC